MAANGWNKTDCRLAARCAAVASIGAAVIHFGVAPMHGRDWLPSGLFFAAIAVFQLMWAFVVWMRPIPLVLTTGILANTGSVGLWVMSRIVGAPFGPYAGQPEAVDTAGICVLLLQCYVVMGAGWAWPRRFRVGEVSNLGRALVLLGANTVMAGAVTVGLASSQQGHDHHHHGGTDAAQAEHQAVHDAHTAGDHRNADPAASPDVVAPQPSSAPTSLESGLPVTDMGLETDGHHHDHHD